MITKLFRKLGYVPISELEDVKSINISLNNQLNLNKINAKNLREHVNKHSKIEEEYNEYKNYSDKKLEELKQTIKKKDLRIKNLKKNNHRLLEKQAIFKKEMANKEDLLNQMELINNNQQQKIIFLNAYNYAVLERLEYICFGSILPKVMKQVDIQYYSNPLETIKRKFIETPTGLVLQAQYENK